MRRLNDLPNLLVVQRIGLVVERLLLIHRMKSIRSMLLSQDVLLAGLLAMIGWNEVGRSLLLVALVGTLGRIWVGRLAERRVRRRIAL